MNKLLCVATIFLAGSITIKASIMDRCELAKTLLNNGIPREDLGTWSCIARYESEYKTHAIGGYTYGIFQIMGGGHWCADEITRREPDCHLSCQALLDDDLSDDIRCALKIKRIQGFNAWSVWRNKCQHENLKKYTQGCNL